MPWTEITRPDYDRRGQHYASDSTDEEWALVAPFMPPKSKVGAPARHRYARGLGRDPVYGRNRMSVGDAAQGLPAVHDGAVLLLPDARPWPARCSERRPGQGVAFSVRSCRRTDRPG